MITFALIIPIVRKKVVIQNKYQGGWDGWGMYHANLKGRDHSEDLGIDGKTILEWILGN